MRLRERTDRSSTVSIATAHSNHSSLPSEERQWARKLDSIQLVVQIPCLNEEETIGSVIASIRAATADIGRVTILVVDDGSTDRTVAVALASGADFVAKHARNLGLARAYLSGLAAAVNLGADIIVNTDADNQYDASYISAIIAPILKGNADLVVGARPIATIAHFSPMKKLLQQVGSLVVRKLSKTEVADATSGFRAVSRSAAIRLNTFSDYTYTLETLIQAGRSGLRVVSVGIDINPPTRPSRLIRSMWRYVLRSAVDMVRIFTIYAPMRSYLIAGSMPVGVALLLQLRYVFLMFFSDPSRSHAPSLILSVILAILGFLLWALGGVGEIMAVNRFLLEEMRLRNRQADADAGRLTTQTDYVLIARNGPI